MVKPTGARGYAYALVACVLAWMCTVVEGQACTTSNTIPTAATADLMCYGGDAQRGVMSSVLSDGARYCAAYTYNGVRTYGGLAAGVAATIVGGNTQVYICNTNNCNSPAASNCGGSPASPSSSPAAALASRTQTPVGVSAGTPSPAAIQAVPPCTTRDALNSITPSPGVSCYFGQRVLSLPFDPTTISVANVDLSGAQVEYCVAYDANNNGQLTRFYNGLTQQQLVSMFSSPSYSNWFVCTTNSCNGQPCTTPPPAATTSALPMGAIIGIAVGGGALCIAAAAGFMYVKKIGPFSKLASPPSGLSCATAPTDRAIASHGGNRNRQAPASTRRLMVPSTDPSAPSGWERLPNGTYVSPNGNPHQFLPPDIHQQYHGLPAGWEVDYDAGDVFYINTLDGTTQWDRPNPLGAASAGMMMNPMRK